MLNGIESAALNGTKGFRQIVVPMTEAERATKAGTTALDGHAKGLQGLIGPLGVMVGAYAAYKALNMVGEALSQAAALKELAAKTGLAVETLSVLEFAGRRVGVTTPEINMAIRGLALGLGNLRDGQPKVVEAFRELGLQARDFAGLNTEQAFRKIVDAMASLPDGLQKSEIAARVFGRAGAELIPLLNDLANGGFARVTEEATRMGVVISTKVANDANAFFSAWGDFKNLLGSTSRDLAMIVLPTLTGILRFFAEGVPAVAAFSQELRNLHPTVSNKYEDLRRRMGLGPLMETDWDANDTEADLEARRRAIRGRHGQGIVELPKEKSGKPESEEARLRRLMFRFRGQQFTEAPDRLEGGAFGTFGGVRTDRIDTSGNVKKLLDESAGIQGDDGGRRRRGEDSPVFRQLLQSGEAVKDEFALLGTKLGVTLADGFAAALGAGLQGKNPFKAFGNVVLQGLGSIMTQMGQALISYGVTMLKLLPFLTNIFTSGPAAIAAGVALTALGMTLGSLAHSGGGGGGGGGGGFAQRDQVTNVTLTRDGAGGAKAPQSATPVHFTIIGANDPQAQRQIVELVNNAQDRNIRVKNG